MPRSKLKKDCEERRFRNCGVQCCSIQLKLNIYSSCRAGMPKPSGMLNSLCLKSSYHVIDDQTGQQFGLSICNQNNLDFQHFENFWSYRDYGFLILVFSWLSSALNHWFIKTNKQKSRPLKHCSWMMTDTF